MKIKFKYIVTGVILLGLGYLLFIFPNMTDVKSNTNNMSDGFKEGVRIFKYPENYTCFKFETPDGKRIISDPYLMNEKVKPDIVTISHWHIDHDDLSMLEGSYELLDKPGSYDIKGIHITGIAGRHDSDLNPDSVQNVIFTYEIGGIKIAQLASQGKYPSEEMFEKIGKPDVVIFQIYNGGGKMDLNECRRVVERLKPKIIIPAHGNPDYYDTFSYSIGSVKEESGDGEILITKGELKKIKTPRVIVLDNWPQSN